jgi:small subunit ribosomal protein S4e
VLRNRLKYALTRREVVMIVMRRSVMVDGKVRTDINYPAGFMDVITVPKTDEQFRLLYDVKGRFVLHRITKDEAKYKLARVVRVAKGSKASIGRNPLVAPGQQAAIPYGTTSDGRTIRFLDPAVKSHDSVKLDIESGKVIGHYKFDIGNLVMVTKGANVGRVGLLVSKEKHEGSFDIVHIKDRKNNVFATRSENVFVIGTGSKPEISLPKGKGVKLSVLEERDQGKQKSE